MDPAHDRPDRNVGDVGYLLVRKTLDVGEQNGYPERFGERLDRPLHLVVGYPLEQFILRRSPRARGRELTQTLVEVEVLDVLDVGLLRTPFGGPIAVYERVREYPVEPGLQVRSFFEGPESSVRLQESLLDEVFRVGRIRVIRSAAL